MTETIQSGFIQSFDEEKREFQFQVLPWDTFVSTSRGYEKFEKGSFEDLDPSRFVLRQRHQDPPTGRGISLEETDTHLLMGFKVARTRQGDEQIELYREGVETGVSVGFEDAAGEGTVYGTAEDGRKTIVHKKIAPDKMLEVSTTYIPAFGTESKVLAYFDTREKESMSEPMGEAEVQTPAPVVTFDRAILSELESKLLARIDRLEERQAASMLNVPPAEGSAKGALIRQVELHIRELADIVTTDNMGVVPDAIVNEMLGRVDAGRPFLNATRRLTTPAAGTRLIVPRLVSGPAVDTQESEKHELESQATEIDTVDFGMITVGGAADLSMQLIKRSSPEFLGLFFELLGEAYATDTDDKAVDALLAEAAVVEGGEFDPASPSLGGAFSNTAAATGRLMTPDRIFLSTAAIAAFIDAVEPAGGGGRPLYPGLAQIAGLGGGGSIPGAFTLQPVWVPALDDEAVDIIVGPSRGFAWAEDGTYRLEADVPSKFGRDIALAGMIWYAPTHPAAFTTYTLVS